MSREARLKLIGREGPEPMPADPARTPTGSQPALHPAAQSGMAPVARDPDAPQAPHPHSLSRAQQVAKFLHITDGAAARWMLFISLIGGTGAGGFFIGGGGKNVTEKELESLETQLRSELSAMDGRVDDLEPLTDRVDSTYEMSALALEISVESHRYLSDLIVDATKQDYPDYSPPAEDVRLQRRLRRGEQVLDELDAPKAR